jgi:DNA-binding beta-propeller fold protein YncE/mono/diheme cytochrome c family protein
MARSFPLVLLLALSSCGRERVAPPGAAPSVLATATGGARERPPAAHSWLSLAPVDRTGGVSAGAVALARLGDRTLAFVADADDGVVVTLDADGLRPLASTPIGARPSAVLVTTTGRVIALGADDARVRVLGMAAVDRPLEVERAIAVPQEPVSAALLPGGDALLVASRWGHALSVVPLTGDVAPSVIDLPRDPAAVVASSDGHRAFVLHAVGSRASVVDLGARSARTVSLDRKTERDERPSKRVMQLTEDDFAGAQSALSESKAPAARKKTPESFTITLHTDQAFAVMRTSEGIVSPVVAVDTGADAVSDGYGGRGAAATAAVVLLDEGGAGAPASQRVFGRCLLPRGAALDASGSKLFVACLGSNEVAVLRLGPHGVQRETPVTVPGGPVAISVDDASRRAVVWSAFDRTVSLLAIDATPKVVAKATLPRMTPGMPAPALRGRALFHAVFDARVSSDGRACASCHPDARDDGLAWSSPGGRRQTPMLLERLEGTAPYGWDGAARDVETHLEHTTARLGGTGLGKQDVADIQAYIATLHPPAATNAEDDALAARGRELFHSDDVGCGGCHAGAALTDGDEHDVESARHDGLRRSFDTPSLHLIAYSAPYFHDGRYATLSALLSGTDGAMGHTSQLSPGDRAALEAYLRRL